MARSGDPVPTENQGKATGGRKEVEGQAGSSRPPPEAPAGLARQPLRFSAGTQSCLGAWSWTSPPGRHCPEASTLTGGGRSLLTFSASPGASLTLHTHFLFCASTPDPVPRSVPTQPHRPHKHTDFLSAKKDGGKCCKVFFRLLRKKRLELSFSGLQRVKR